MAFHRFVAAALLGCTALAPAAAQEYRGPDAYTRGYYPWHTERSEAISRSTIAETARANERAEAEIGDGYVIDDDRYARDRAAYDEAVRAHGRETARYAADYVRSQRAYAMAMDEWRAQVDACDAGVRRACYAPTPEPADYW